jgi:hypothetical protein
MTPNEIGQACYEAHQQEARKLYDAWHYIPRHHLSTGQQKVWERAGEKTYLIGRGDEFQVAYNEGFSDGYATGSEYVKSEYEV